MSAGPRRRTIRPASSSPNAGAGPVPLGETVPNPMPAGVRQWSPTVANLLVILVLEVVAFAALRYVFGKVT